MLQGHWVDSCGILLVLQFVEIVGQAIEAFVPEVFVGLDPVVYGLQALVGQRVKPLLSIRAHAHEAHLLQDRQVLGGLGLGEAQQAGDVVDRALALGDQVKDLAPARFRDRVEGIGGCR